MDDTTNNETRERLLDIADELFSKRGYTGVRLRDIANAMGMKHASLYYYAPDGKQQLFIEVMERNLRRHYDGLTQAIAEAGTDLREQMYAAALWLASQPPLNISRMAQSDVNELTEAQAHHLMNLAFTSLQTPIATALDQARQASMIKPSDSSLAAIAFVSLIQSVHNMPREFGPEVKTNIARQLVDMLLDGWLQH